MLRRRQLRIQLSCQGRDRQSRNYSLVPDLCSVRQADWLLPYVEYGLVQNGFLEVLETVFCQHAHVLLRVFE